MKLNFSWHMVTSLAISAFGILSSPAIMGILPPQYAAIVTGLGVIYQALAPAAVVSAAPAAVQVSGK